jgi:predicted DNA-binding protein
MAVLTLKLTEDDARRLARQAREEGKTKSDYVRALIRERITTAGDLLELVQERMGKGLGLEQG